jgi:beta-galactosidase
MIMKDNNAVLFNTDWKFLLGDPMDAYRDDFNDRTWKHIDLPHDWVISQPFYRGENKTYNTQNMQGFFVWEGVAWYRKEFTLPDITGREVYLYFGGAYRNSTIYVNGRKAGGRVYGYSSFELDISAFVKPGEKNHVAVRIDNGCEASDRWYSGSGLYRDVYIRIVPRVHIKTWGVHVSTNILQDGAAEVIIDTTITNNRNTASRSPKYLVSVQIQGPLKQAASETFQILNTKNQGKIEVRQRCIIEKPLLWSAEEPNLYRAFVAIESDSDSEVWKPVEVPFGIRTIEIVSKKGMTVNGTSIKLKGVCVHHECGILGSAFYAAAWRRRLGILKGIGCNAIRTAHNPPAEEFLDLCDEMGFYVIDECFDKWKSGYYGDHFEDNWQKDLEAFILRDRNHPSVFMWSIGNEIEDQGSDEMLKIQKMLASFVRTMDDRPITCALQPHVNPRTLINAPVSELVELTKKLAEDVDVLGLNYQEDLYKDYTAGIDKPIVGTESYEYYCGTASNYEDVTTKNPWRFVLENDNVIGQFIWAGIDYFGECGWPAKGWAAALLDNCAFLKPNAWYRKSIWQTEPMIYLTFYDMAAKPNYVRGRWSFPKTSSHLNLDHLKRETVTTAIFTNCDEAELWINGKKLGRRNPANFENGIIEWTFEYASGEVKVIGYRKGKEACSHVLKTAGVAQKILLEPDKTTLSADSADIAHVEVTIADENGILCPNEDLLVEFALTGDGQILGACSPDLNASLGCTLPKAITSGGKALVIIKSGAGAGLLELTAYSEKLPPAALQFKVE